MYEMDYSQIKTFSDVTTKMTGKRIKIAEIIGTPIVIWKINISNSVYRQEDEDPDKMYATIQFSIESDESRTKYVTGSSSYYLIDDLNDIKDKLPIRATICSKNVHEGIEGREPKFVYSLS